jgi:hypothetical protein
MHGETVTREPVCIRRGAKVFNHFEVKFSMDLTNFNSILYIFSPLVSNPVSGNAVARSPYPAIFFLNSLGVRPVCFLKTVLKEDLELNPTW